MQGPIVGLEIRWYFEHPPETRPLVNSDFFSNPSAAAVFLVRRLGLA